MLKLCVAGNRAGLHVWRAALEEHAAAETTRTLFVSRHIGFRLRSFLAISAKINTTNWQLNPFL
jgi:hypothetical protein